MTPDERDVTAYAIVDKWYAENGKVVVSGFARRQLRLAILQALRDERRRALDEAAGAVQNLTGKDSGNWNRCVAYAVAVIRELQEPS